MQSICRFGADADLCFISTDFASIGHEVKLHQYHNPNIIAIVPFFRDNPSGAIHFRT
jgi:hypothetical protein